MEIKILTKENNAKGFTLVELMVGLALAVIVTAVMYSAFEGQVRGQQVQSLSLQMTQGLRAAVEMMTTDIRMAGCDPTEDADAGFEVADAGNLVFTMDIGGNADGSPNGVIEPGERVRYAINVSNHLGRATGLGLLTPLNTLHSVDMECDTLNFVYLTDDNDGDGVPDILPSPVGNPDDIRAVQVNIRVHWDADPQRWFSLSNTIACRNS